MWVNVPSSGKRGLGQTSRRRGRLLDPARIRGIDHLIDLPFRPRWASTTHFEVTGMLDEMVGWLDREPMVPLVGRPLLGCEGGPIVHSFLSCAEYRFRGGKSVGARSAPPRPLFIRASKVSLLSQGMRTWMRNLHIYSSYLHTLFFVATTNTPTSGLIVGGKGEGWLHWQTRLAKTLTSAFESAAAGNRDIAPRQFLFLVCLLSS